MANYDVIVTGLKQVPLVNKLGKFATVTRVTIMVGDHGGFTKDFPEGEDTPEIINAWKQQKQNEVRAIAG